MLTEGGIRFGSGVNCKLPMIVKQGPIGVDFSSSFGRLGCKRKGEFMERALMFVKSLTKGGLASRRGQVLQQPPIGRKKNFSKKKEALLLFGQGRQSVVRKGKKRAEK